MLSTPWHGANDEAAKPVKRSHGVAARHGKFFTRYDMATRLLGISRSSANETKLEGNLDHKISMIVPTTSEAHSSKQLISKAAKLLNWLLLLSPSLMNEYPRNAKAVLMKAAVGPTHSTSSPLPGKDEGWRAQWSFTQSLNA